MKYLGLILVVALVAGQVLARGINENDSLLEHSHVVRGLSDTFQSFLEEKLRVMMREGNAALGIPQLDPFAYDLMELKINEDIGKGNVTLKKIAVEGIADYQVNVAKISILGPKMTVGLTWPRIQSRGSHAFNFAFSESKIKFSGNGDFTAGLEQLAFQTEVSLGIVKGAEKKEIRVKGMKTKISLGGLELKATGLLEDDDASMIISAVISDVLPQLIEDYHTEITTRLNDIVMKMANDKLTGLTIAEILGMLN